MVDAIRMWILFASASARRQLEYRTSFLLGAFGQLLTTGIEFVGLWALFDRFGSLKGWTLPEVALFYGTAHVSFAIADMLGSGFDDAGTLIRHGHLDRLLLRPRTTVLQLLGHDLSLRRLGRMVQGLAVLCWALASLEHTSSVGHVLLLVVTIACGVCLFLGLLAIQATLSIWTIQTLEIVNCATDGGDEFGEEGLEPRGEIVDRFSGNEGLGIVRCIVADSLDLREDDEA